MIGVLLLGGTGSRLSPMTKFVNKHLLPIYDMPMFFYPWSFMVASGVREFVFVVNPGDRALFEDAVGDGSAFGLKISYVEQGQPDGIPSAASLAIPNIPDDSDGVLLMLGDNILIANEVVSMIKSRGFERSTNHLFTYHVEDPTAFGVFDKETRQIIEKPTAPRTNYAVIGLYYYTLDTFRTFGSLKKSERNETEISQVNNELLAREDLSIHQISRGNFWMDAGTFKDFARCGNYCENVQAIQGFRYGCIDEVCYRNGLIDESALEQRILHYGENSEMSIYLRKVINSID